MSSSVPVTHTPIRFTPAGILCAAAVFLILLGAAARADARNGRSADEAAWQRLSDEALQLFQMDQLAQATVKAEAALQYAETTFGPKHPTVARSLNNLAMLYKAQPEYQEAAEPVYRRAIEVWQLVYGRMHARTAESINNLAELYRVQGRYDEAEPLYLKSLEIRKRTLGERHADVAQSLNNLAELYRGKGLEREAEEFYQEALRIYEHAAPTHPDLVTLLTNYAALLKNQGESELAESLMDHANTLREHLGLEPAVILVPKMVPRLAPPTRDAPVELRDLSGPAPPAE